MTKRTLLLSLPLLFAGQLAQAGHSVTRADRFGTRECRDVQLCTTAMEKPVQGKPASEPTRADEPLYTVTPVFTYDAEKGVMPAFEQVVMTTDGSASYIYNAFGDMVINPWTIPAGEYDFLFSFSSPDGMLFVAKEGVKVEADMEIEVNAGDAYVNDIEWDFRLPDGRSPLDDDLVDTRIVSLTLTAFHLPNLQAVYQIGATDRMDPGKENNVEWMRPYLKVRINDATRFSLSQIIAVVEDGTQYYANMPVDGLKSQTIGTDLNRYQNYSINMPNDWSNITGGKDPIKKAYWGYDLLLGTRTFTGIDALCDFTTDKLYSQFYYYGPSKEIPSSISMMPKVQVFTDYDAGLNRYFGITYPLIAFDGSEFQFQTARIGYYGNCAVFIYYNYGIDGRSRPGINSEISLDVNENPVFGASAPMILFSRPSERFEYEYLGRYGEVRTLDYLNQKFSIRLDGKEVWNDYLNTTGFFNNEDMGAGIAYDKGVWEYDIESNNVVVDGLKSSTRCLMRFEENDEFSWPTLTALQLRNTSDDITDKFEKASDGKIIFMGGEWSIGEPGVECIYNCVEPESITLEYAPYGSEEFLPLEFVNIPEKRYMPGYGDYYEASLAQIDRTSPTGWFGVKFTITDHQGNTQTQTVTPAFHISGLSSVGNINADTTFAVQVENGCIIAPEGSKIYNASGIEVGPAGLSPGVYFVRYGDRTEKLVLN